MGNKQICKIAKLYEQIDEFHEFDNKLKEEFGEGTCNHASPILNIDEYFQNSNDNWVVAILHEMDDSPNIHDFQIAFRNIEDGIRFKLTYG